jgi:hypothetical protein
VNALLNALLTIGPLALLAALIAAPLYYLAWRRAPEPKRALPGGRYALTTLAAGALAYVAGAVGGVWAACSAADAGNLCGLFGIFGIGPLAAAVAIVLYARSAAGNARRAL